MSKMATCTNTQTHALAFITKPVLSKKIKLYYQGKYYVCTSWTPKNTTNVQALLKLIIAIDCKANCSLVFNNYKYYRSIMNEHFINGEYTK